VEAQREAARVGWRCGFPFFSPQLKITGERCDGMD
jgi:hypothetical protein